MYKGIRPKEVRVAQEVEEEGGEGEGWHPWQGILDIYRHVNEYLDELEKWGKMQRREYTE